VSYRVTLLGTSSAMPSRGRFPSAQLIQLNDWYGLIDCGEGTQIQMGKYNIKRNRISHIFISHFHGDHVFGLPGLLGSYNHFNRRKPLNIYGPKGLDKLIHTIAEISGAHYNYEIIIHELDHLSPGSIRLSENIEIRHFPLKHRIPTIGYRFDYQSVSFNIRKECIDKYNLTIEEIKTVKSGNDITRPDGVNIQWQAVAEKKEVDKSYAYCSDTIYDPSIISNIKGIHFLYHETTYLDGMEQEAKDRMHATLGQAVDIAIKANAGTLITGHYSSRYSDLEDFEKAAADYLSDIIIGQEGLNIEL
jgi:ribonuclease Z